MDYVLRQCCAAINRDGLEVQGIFRLAGMRLIRINYEGFSALLLPGSASRIRRLKSAFNSGYADLSSPDSYSNDIHAVADVVKVLE